MSVSEANLKNKIEFQKLKEKITEENILALFNQDPCCLFQVHHIRCFLFKTEETILNEGEKATLSTFIRDLCNIMEQKKMLDKIGHTFKLSKSANKISSNTEKTYSISKFNIGKRKKTDDSTVQQNKAPLVKKIHFEQNKKPKTSTTNFFPPQEPQKHELQSSLDKSNPQVEKENIESSRISKKDTTETVEIGKIPINFLLN